MLLKTSGLHFGEQHWISDIYDGQTAIIPLQLFLSFPQSKQIDDLFLKILPKKPIAEDVNAPAPSEVMFYPASNYRELAKPFSFNVANYAASLTIHDQDASSFLLSVIEAGVDFSRLFSSSPPFMSNLLAFDVDFAYYRSSKSICRIELLIQHGLSIFE